MRPDQLRDASYRPRLRHKHAKRHKYVSKLNILRIFNILLLCSLTAIRGHSGIKPISCNMATQRNFALR